MTGKYIGQSKPLRGSRLAEATRHREHYKLLMSDSVSNAVMDMKSKALQNGLSLCEFAYFDLFSFGFIDKVIVGPSRLSQLKVAIQILRAVSV